MWEKFKSSFIKNIEKSPEQEMIRFKFVDQRKYFFKNYLFPIIAEDLDLKYEETKEFLKVDYTFFKPGSKYKWEVPMIFVESENDWSSCYEEVIKLCSLNAPLKVLVLYNLNEENTTAIKNKDHNWDYILDDFKKETLLVGTFAVIIYMHQTELGILFKVIIYNENIQEREEDLFINFKR